MHERHGRPFTAALETIVLLLVCAAKPAAQTSPTPPAGEAALLLGPVTLFPAFRLRDVGIDSNIFNNVDGSQQQDFTFTALPSVRAVLPVGPTQLTGSATLGFVYYATYKSQQSFNRTFEGRFEGTAARLRPFIAGALSHSRQRAGFEIDARILREAASISGGAEFSVTAITSLTGSYRHTSQNHGDDEQFLGTALAAQLDQTIDVASAGARFAFTPLTTVLVDVQVQRDRFETAPLRDADSVQLIPGVAFALDAAITGRAGAGFRRFSPRDPRLDEFRGLVGYANLGYSLLDVTRFSVEAIRDVMYSFDPATPYFLLTSGRVTVSQRVVGPLDLIVVAGQDRLQYQAVEDLPVSGRVERTRMVGGGVGLRLGPALRLELIYDVTERVSNQFDRREYQRRRLFGSATYGQP